MARHHALDEDDDLPAGPRRLTREKLKAFVERRYSTRLHMTLILLASGFASMIASWTLLHAGVHSMLVRYPVSLTLSYVTFLFGIWAWLRVTGLGPPERAGAAGRRLKDGGIDLPLGNNGGSIGSGGSSSGGGALPRGGGGAFDGGGASASFAEQRIPMAVAVADSDASTTSSSTSSKSGGGLDLGLDGDGLVLIILAILLVAAIFLCSGYLVWMAPDVLTEAAFGAALTGTLARPTARQTATGWIAGVVRKTWWPFAIVLLVALLFAAWAASHYPHAATFKQAIAAATHSQPEK